MELRTATKSCRKNFWMIPSRNIQKVDKTHEYSRLNFIRKTTNPKDRESTERYSLLQRNMLHLSVNLAANSFGTGSK
mgnify:CR=1 FL=1